MAGSSLLMLIDDIATVLDDVAVMTKVAAKKTAGVLGDDLALNAEQVSGVRAERELPVVWAVAKGSLVNKFILVPAALLISALVPWLITPLLMLGGAYLCYEGVEKVFHKFLHSAEEDAQAHKQLTQAFVDEKIDLVAFEQEKIKGAIRTDFVLSAEIIVIALGVVASMPLLSRSIVVACVALAMTVGVYGIVALIVKLDDMGLYLLKRPGVVNQLVGKALLAAAPKVMRFLAVVGTLAMFLVGGGIAVHGIAPLHHLVAQWMEFSGGFAWLVELLANGLVGLLVGLLVLALVSLSSKVFTAKK